MLFEIIYNKTGIFLFNSRMFSTGGAMLTAFLFAIFLFPPYIKLLRKIHFCSELKSDKGDSRREPVMPAGLLFLVIIIFVSFITARFNSYVISALSVYVFFSIIGGVDDIAKVVNSGKLSRGLITRQEYQYKADGIPASLRLFLYLMVSLIVAVAAYKYIPNISGHMTIPFISSEKYLPYLPFWIFIPIMAFTIAIMANGVNFTDGFDTLASVPLITCSLFVGVIAYISSNELWSRYLLIPFIPGIEEMLPLIGSVIGVLLAFLWYNSPPSSIIMGDSGSIGLGGFVGITFIFIKAGFYLPVVGFIFVLEFVSSFIQIANFKLTGKRIFLMAPIHHHFHLIMKRNPFYRGNSEIKSKITWRFHIVSVILLVAGLVLFLKVR